MLQAAVVRAKAKAAVDEGAGEPTCLLDFWTRTVLRDMAKAQADGTQVAHHSSDHEMACVMLDFLFAAQDASTSSLDWTIALMSEHRDVLRRVREEQDAVRAQSRDDDIDYELLEQMPYTRAVVKEILRFRPPAPMMPFQVNGDITVPDPANNGEPLLELPKGSMFIADIWGPCLDGFPNGHVFDPDRIFVRREDVTFKDNFATFGSGPHVCVGQQCACTLYLSLLRALNGMNQRALRRCRCALDHLLSRIGAIDDVEAHHHGQEQFGAVPAHRVSRRLRRHVSTPHRAPGRMNQ